MNTAVLSMFFLKFAGKCVEYCGNDSLPWSLRPLSVMDYRSIQHIFRETTLAGFLIEVIVPLSSSG
jgi:hypothetical protein